MTTHLFSYEFKTKSANDIYKYLKSIDTSLKYNDNNLIILCDNSSNDNNSSYNYVIYQSKTNTYSYNIDNNSKQLNYPITNYFWPLDRKEYYQTDIETFNGLEKIDDTNITFNKYNRYTQNDDDISGATNITSSNKFKNELLSEIDTHFNLFLCSNSKLKDYKYLKNADSNNIHLSDIINHTNIQFNKVEKFPTAHGIEMSTNNVSYLNI